MAKTPRRPQQSTAGEPPASSNGLRTFGMHRSDPAAAPYFKALAAGRQQYAGFAGLAATAGADLSQLDPETAAWHHLQQALAEEAIAPLTTPKAEAAAAEFKNLGSEYLPLTGTRTVKFRQTFHKIPVYGSLVTVELDEHNECLGIRTVLGSPQGVDPVARLAPAEILAKTAQTARCEPQQVPSLPRLHYFFDRRADRWRLVYIVENVPVEAPRDRTPDAGHRAGVSDLVFDAHSGDLVAALPRTARMAAETTTGQDGTGRNRTFVCDRTGSKATLCNPTLNVRTYDFAFRDPLQQQQLLPGEPVTNPPAPWPCAAVDAHANTEEVARFLREVLKRNNIDNRGGAITSTVNCVVKRDSPGGKEWMNAFWDGMHEQMVYGQRDDATGLHSLAENPDIVGHELFHGVTDSSARLEYAEESGALNESYSDTFGIIVSNWHRKSFSTWNWEIGEGVSAGGVPFRNLRQPGKYGQPSHLRDYRHSSNDEAGDYGGVHTNSGIHNYAAYRIMATTSGQRRRSVFTAAEVAALFYICLTQYLSRTSSFADSRAGVLLAAQTLFRKASPAARMKKLRAIERGFRAAGITG